MNYPAKHADNGPAVSVIIPAYQVANYIGAAIDSVLRQTFHDFEIIVVNDGSPDTEELESVLEHYGRRITYIKQENGGPSAARNVAIRRARGQMLAFLDADDYWEPTYLEEQLNFFDGKPGLDLVYSDALLVGDTALAGRTFLEMNRCKDEVTFENLLGGRCTVILSGTVVRKRSVVDAGLFDEGIRYAEDYDLWVRLARNGSRLACQRKVLLSKRMHPASLSSDRVKLHRSALGVLEKIERSNDLRMCEREAIAEQVAKLRAILRLEEGKLQLASGNFIAAREAIREANGFYHSWKLRVAFLCLRFSPRLLLRIYNLIDPLSSKNGGADQFNERGESLTARAALYMFAKTIAFMFSFALPLLLVRRLSQHEFGLYKQVFLVVGTALNILPLGVGMSAYYFLPREHERRGQIVFNILLFYLFMAGSTFLVLTFSPQALAAIFNSSELDEYSPLVGLVILLWIVSSFLETAAVAYQEFRLATVFVISSQFSKTGLLLAAALIFGTVWGLIYAAIAQGAIQTIILFVYLRSRFGPFWRSFQWSVMRSQLAYALPLGIAAVIIGMQSDIDNYFVANRFGPVSYAIYAIGCFQLPLLAIISDSVGSVMIPRVSYLQKVGNRREIIELTAEMMRRLSAVYFPLYAFLLVMGREFLTLLFTSQYLDSYPIFAINLTLIPLAIITSGCDPVMRAYAEHRYFLLRARVTLLVILIASLWYVSQRYGMVGTIATAISVSFIERVITLHKASRIMQVRRGDIKLLKDTGKLAVAAGIAGVVVALMRPMLAEMHPIFSLTISGAVFSAAFLSLVAILRVLSERERQTIIEHLARAYRKIAGSVFPPKRQADPTTQPAVGESE